MKTTTWLLVPLALASASCLIELSPSAADPSTAPAPFVRPDAAAQHASDASAIDASAIDASNAATTIAPEKGALDVDAGSDASTAADATSL